MSGKQSRHISPPTPSSPPTQAHPPSKLPKFLQKQSTRDRSRSITDPTAGGASTTSLASLASGSSAASTSSDIPGASTTKTPRKSSKFLAITRDRDRGDKDKDKDSKGRRSVDVQSQRSQQHSEVDEPLVIVEPPEPVAIPRPRTRSERPLSADSLQHPQNLYASTSSSTSTSRIGDLPTRLSGWFSHTFSTSSTDLSLPSILSSSLSQSGSPASPRSKTASSALLTAAKHGKGHLDKAVRYLLDSDSTPDKCTDPIWLLGVQHPGYESPPPPPPVSLQSSTSSRRNSGSFRSSTSSNHVADPQLSQSQSGKHVNPALNWPPAFYADFTSQVWLTYRSQFTPIRDMRLADLDSGEESAASLAASPTTVRSRPWNWGGEKGWTSDSGWGCMLRTGQSLLASSLVYLHLGRDWRRPPYPVHTADYATYVQIMTWFFDTPAPEAPFSVHRMALAGKELGKDVGQWFGPSTAAGALKTLVGTFPEAGLGVAVANDGVVYQTDVYAASNTTGTASRSPKRHMKKAWGDRPVLVLIGIRLGIDGVNPIYHDTIKLLYTFPQSVGIAGGRPGSSYYFVGSQADNLFYLDPHHTRPAISLRPPPPMPVFPYPSGRETTPESDREGSKVRTQRSPPPNHHRAPTSPSSTRTGSSTFSYHAPISPSPLQQEFSQSTGDGSSSSNTNHKRNSRSPPPSQQHSRWRSASQPASPGSDMMDHRELSGFGSVGEGLDPVQEHYVTAYSTAELKTFHCERVRKMPLSGLDPSMLIGFFCKDEADWRDFRKRVGDLPKLIFSVQDEPPTWPSDSDDNMGLESISEPDDLDMDMDDEDDDAEAEQFFDTRSGSPSTSSASASGGHDGAGGRSKSEEVDTEEDPVDPITPGPNSRFSIGEQPLQEKGGEPRTGGEFDMEGDEDVFENDDIEDDWVDPSIPSPSLSGPRTALPPTTPKDAPGAPPDSADVPSLVKGSSVNGGTKKKKGKKGGQIPVPVPLVKIPAPSDKHTQEHFPFPVTQRSVDDASLTPQERSRTSSVANREPTTGKRMHTARARDGGRTQSGGVKGILTDD
ncbi:hypothetical protein BDZ94DRAFT_1254537 [Collybia nuda]|uniref:Autophagy-related protein 4 n=1 Tax=Collybia nuda TaxID=64659 RepID=A0A9P6CGI8_9AGAR|nr:hypothetical protein BDZ94DRAFT_1254537 [Collybia nuda]